MTLSIAKAIMEACKVDSLMKQEDDNQHCEKLSALTVRYMQDIGRKYPNCGFGGMFDSWIWSEAPKPYNSYGNGAAMRVSPAGFAARSEQESEMLAKTVTEVTHNHKEGIKGAVATTVAIYMARCGALKYEIKERIHQDYYPLDFTVDQIRPHYRFDETCQKTVPQAIKCFLESNSFEDAVRTAVSLGGDSDTIAAITGAIAEAYYGVPSGIKKQALTYLDEDLRAIYDEWIALYPPDTGEFRVLTKYTDKIDAIASLEESLVPDNPDRRDEWGNKVDKSLYKYDRIVGLFVDEFYGFFFSHPEYELTRYSEILENNNFPMSLGDSQTLDEVLSNFDAQCVLARITLAIRAVCGSDLSVHWFVEDGSLTGCLKRLRDIDGSEKTRR